MRRMARPLATTGTPAARHSKSLLGVESSKLMSGAGRAIPATSAEDTQSTSSSTGTESSRCRRPLNRGSRPRLRIGSTRGPKPRRTRCARSRPGSRIAAASVSIHDSASRNRGHYDRFVSRDAGGSSYPVGSLARHRPGWAVVDDHDSTRSVSTAEDRGQLVVNGDKRVGPPDPSGFLGPKDRTQRTRQLAGAPVSRNSSCES